MISYQTALLADDGDALTTMIGDALGEQERARELITESDAAIEAFVAAHPGLDGKTFALGQYFSGTLQLLAGADAPSTRFLARFGLSVPAALAGLDDGSLPAGMASVSPEQFGLLDSADAAYLRMYGEGAEAEFRSHPLVPSLQIERSGALHIISDDLISLLFAPNPAVTGEIVEHFGPLLTELAAAP